MIDVARLPAELSRELRSKALRSAIWLSLLHAQELGYDDVEHQLTSILVDVDERRELEEDVALFAVLDVEPSASATDPAGGH